MTRKRKAKKDRHVTLHMTIPAKLARRLDAMHRDQQARQPYSYISRSQWYSYCLGEFVACLDDPWREPGTPAEVQRRISPADRRSTIPPNATLTPAMVLRIRKDKRTLRKIAADMGVNVSTIARVKNHQTWNWVK